MKTYQLKLFALLILITLFRISVAAQNSTCATALSISNGSSQTLNSTTKLNWVKFTASQTSHVVVVSAAGDTTSPDLDTVRIISGICGTLTVMQTVPVPAHDGVAITLTGLTIGAKYFINTKRLPASCGTCAIVPKQLYFYVETTTSSCVDQLCNGSFESYSSLPGCGPFYPPTPMFSYYTAGLANCWTTQFANINDYYNNPTNYLSTSDYFNTASGNIGCININPDPRTGSGHGGMGFTSDNVNGWSYNEMLINVGTSATIIQGRTYCLTYYYKKVAGTASFTLGMKYGGQLSQTVQGQGSYVAGIQSPAANNWTRVDCYFTAYYSGVFQHTICFGSAAPAPNQLNYIIVDDVSMVESVTIFAGSGTTACAYPIGANMQFYANGSVTYNWSISPTATIYPTGSSCMVTSFPTPGTYTLTVSGTTAGGCTSTASVLITVNPTPTAAASSSATMCLGQGVITFTATPTGSGYTYQWYATPNSAVSGATNSQYTPFSSGTYFCTVTNTFGCTGVSNTVTATYYPAVQAAIMADGDESCPDANDGTVLGGVTGGTAPFNYSWSPTSPTQTTIGASGLDNGSYTFTVTDANGCSATAVGNVGTQSLPPVPIIVSDNTTGNLCNNQVVTYTITNYDPTLDYTISYNETPANVNTPISGSFEVDWGAICNDVIFTVTVGNGSGNPICDVSASLEIDGCCVCKPEASDAIMTGSPGSKTVVDLYNAYSPSGFITQIGNTYYYNNPNGILYINGDFLVLNNTNLEIIASEVRFGSDAAIYLMGSATMTIDNSHLAAGCDDMWDGIYISTNGALFTKRNSLIEDAKHAVVSPGGALFQLDETVFNKNRISVDVLNYSGTHPGTITNCVFTCRDLTSGTTVAMVKGSQNTTPFIQVFPVVGYTPATMLSPYAGQRSYAGVYVNSNGSTVINSTTFQVTSYDAFHVGDPSGGYNTLNVFDYMDFGVYAYYSNFVVENNAFQYITGPTTVSKFGPSYGIAVYGKTFSEQEAEWVAHVGGLSSGQRNTFFECGRGVDIEGYYDVEVIDNLFQCHQVYSPVVSTTLPITGNLATFVQSGYYIEVELNNNNIVDWATGIVFNVDMLPAGPGQYYRFMGDAYINENRVSPIDPVAGPNSTSYVRTAISTSVVVPSCTNCITQGQIGRLYVERNDLDQVFNGIVVQNWTKRPRIADNLVHMRYQPNASVVFAQTGIRLIKNNTAIVYRNVITGDANTVNEVKVRGIYATRSTNGPVWCNIMTDLGSCMVFEGTCLGIDTRNNEMNDAIYGFVLLNNGMVGPQGSAATPLYPNGKTCDNLWNGPFSLADTYTDNTSTPDLHSPIYVRDPLLNSAYVPVVNLTTGSTSLDDYNAPNALTIIYTSAPYIDCDLAPAIAEDEFVVDEEGMIMVMERIANDQIAFNCNTTEEEWAAKSAMFGLIYENPNLMSGSRTLQTFYASAENKSEGQCVQVDDYFGDSRIDDGASLNAGMITTNAFDQYLQDVNAIYASAMATGEITETELTFLETIAAMCPTEGGEAVYRARMLIDRVGRTYTTYDEECTCGSGSRLAPPADEPTSTSAPLYAVYPNPTSGLLNIQYNTASKEPVYFTVYDVTGRVVQSVQLPADATLYVLDLSGLANGLYHYTISNSSQVLKSDKITITE